MIKPTTSELLGGVAASLDETVLPELPPGSTRNQLVAAIAIIRRCAAVGDRIGPYLWDDNRDILAVLSEVTPLVGLDPPSSAMAAYPTLEELRQQNLELQEQLVAVHDALRDAPSDAPARVALRALFERMLARESHVNITTWA